MRTKGGRCRCRRLLFSADDAMLLSSSLCWIHVMQTSLAVSDVCTVDGDKVVLLARHVLALQGHVLGHDRADL